METRAEAARGAFLGMSGLFWSIALFSIFVNLLMLTGPLYMLQIYDRVLSSRSEETLVSLTLLIAALFAVMGVLDYLRGRVAARVGATVQARLDPTVFSRVLDRAVMPADRSNPATGLKDLEAIQKFMSSPVMFAIFDMPWAPIFIAAIFVFHPWLGWLAVAGGLVLVATTLLNQTVTRQPELRATLASMNSDAFAEVARSHAETVRALGMQRSVLGHWQSGRARALTAQIASADRLSQFATFSKTFRFFLQSAILGLGAYLVLLNELTPGAMIAASILLGRALAPVEQAIGGWPLAQRARLGWRNLRELLADAGPRETTRLPRPGAYLDVEQVTVVPPGQRKAALRMLSFRVRPGEALGVIGVSAAGKSTLAKVLTGLWRPASGSVRLDGAALEQYEPETLGRYIGYLPQDVVLFDATVAANIARLDPDPDPEAVVAAAKLAGAHEMILTLPEGYDTPILAHGARLSGGQRQRIALARAFYGDPVLLVLDEPNSALDADGSDALNAAIRAAKEAGKAVVIMAHRPAGIAECDLILLLDQGTARAFGPRDEILKANLRNYTQIAGSIRPELAPS